MKAALGICAFLVLGSVKAQLPQIASAKVFEKIQLQEVGIDESSKSSMSVVPLFKVNQNHVEEYLDLVGADIKNTSIATTEIVPPKEFRSTLSYGYFFQQHGTQNWEPNRLLFVIEGGSNWHQLPKARIWLDRNHDLNFENDIPDTLYYGRANKMIPFFLGSNFTSGLTVNKFPTEQFYRFSQMNDLSIREMCGNRLFLGTDNSLKVERINILYTKVKFGSDTLALGIQDVNSNGDFGDIGVDKWLVAKFRDSIIATQHGQTLQQITTFTWMGYAYQVEIPNDRNGVIILKQSNNRNKSSKTLLIGDKIPKFKFCVAVKNAKRQSSQKLPARPSVWVIWSAENKEFLRDTAILHDRIRRTQDSVNWIFLNFGGSGRYVGYYNRRYEIQVLQGFANSQITAKLKLQHLPQYLYFDDKKRLKYNGTNLQDLLDSL